MSDLPNRLCLFYDYSFEHYLEKVLYQLYQLSVTLFSDIIVIT
jgi:hypothetical protein